MTKERTQVGIALAIAALCTLAAVITAVREPGPSFPSSEDSARSSRPCAGARLTFTVRSDDATRGTLVIADPRRRTWRLSWSGHDGPRSVRATPAGAIARAVFTDLDAGTSVRARPAGGPAACWMSVSLPAY